MFAECFAGYTLLYSYVIAVLVWVAYVLQIVWYREKLNSTLLEFIGSFLLQSFLSSSFSQLLLMHLYFFVVLLINAYPQGLKPCILFLAWGFPETLIELSFMTNKSFSDLSLLCAEFLLPVAWFPSFLRVWVWLMIPQTLELVPRLNQRFMILLII